MLVLKEKFLRNVVTHLVVILNLKGLIVFMNVNRQISIIPITIIIVLLLILPPLFRSLFKEKPKVDICRTPIYRLSVNELNEAVLVCKATKEIRNNDKSKSSNNER